MNLQTPEKKARRDDGLIEVHSIFYTIQGEGPFCGTPAVFIRLAGCNLQCPGCDTEYTRQRKELWPDQIVALARLQLDMSNSYPEYDNWDKIPIPHSLPDCNGRLVVITGGEPFRQNIQRLMERLVGAGFFVQVETNGTLPAPDSLYSRDIASRTGVYVVVSPKTGKVHYTVDRVACAYKYVLNSRQMDNTDGLPTLALMHPAEPKLARPSKNFKGLIYIQPMDCTEEFRGREDMEFIADMNKWNTHACIKSSLRYGYILQLQIHKILGME